MRPAAGALPERKVWQALRSLTARIRYFHNKETYGDKQNGENMVSVSDVSNVFGFLGGLGMFLYGMSIMADGMQ